MLLHQRDEADDAAGDSHEHLQVMVILFHVVTPAVSFVSLLSSINIICAWSCPRKTESSLIDLPVVEVFVCIFACA